jgi:hypothetical protein
MSSINLRRQPHQLEMEMVWVQGFCVGLRVEGPSIEDEKMAVGRSGKCHSNESPKKQKCSLPQHEVVNRRELSIATEVQTTTVVVL